MKVSVACRECDQALLGMVPTLKRLGVLLFDFIICCLQFLFNLALNAPFPVSLFCPGCRMCVLLSGIVFYSLGFCCYFAQSSSSTAKNAGHHFALFKLIPEVGRKHLECLPKVATKLVKVPRPLLDLSL